MTSLRKGVDSELIKDREVAVVAEDRLGHESVVEQLEHLIKTVPTPTNIALYGAWGSGKSGIANLLRERVTHLQGVKFARFDAFKYAENPLRRNFVAAVASSLGIDDKKFHDELYNGKVTNDFQLPLVGLCKLVMVFGGVAGAAIAISLVIMAVVSLVGSAPFGVIFQKNISALFGASLVPASIMTVLFAIVGKVLVVERRSEKLASDEQFETIFRQLVSNAKLEKLVVFVDELDRCSPDNVVATLDAVRTFLGVEKCIFIVASDQQVLEKALTKSVQQATPLDKVNPYYSAGSAYLDKVFQYHISVPPLLPHSVTRYALELVEKRSGVWANINVAQVVSILVPSHVKSPRRVKSLLNSFALFYRLAESRGRAGFLQVAILPRVEEMAKLVCLNVEFPLFARDLLIDHKLPEYVLALFELGSPADYATSSEDTGEDAYNEAVSTYWRQQKYVSQSVKDLAAQYAFSNASLSPLMISANGDKSERSMRDEVERSQARQLIDYLSRTRRVPSPQKDFIHLQSAGNLFGLSAEVAGELELHAQNGSWQKVISIYERLDISGRKGALQFLLQQGRVAIGLEQENIVSCILAIVSDDEVEISAEADQIFDMVEIGVSKSPSLLNPATMRGAWRLSMISDRSDTASLSERILSYDKLPDDVDLVVYILSHSTKAVEIAPAAIADVFVYHLCSTSPEDLLDVITKIGEEGYADVLWAVASRLTGTLHSMSVEFKAAEDNLSKSGTAIPEGVVNPANTINALVSGLVSAETQELKEAILNIILNADHEKFRAGLQSRISDVGCFGRAQNIRSILRAAQLRSFACADWLSIIDKKLMSSGKYSTEISTLLVGLVKNASTQGGEANKVAINSVISLWDSLSQSDREEITKSLLELSLNLTENEDASKTEMSLAAMELLVNAGVLGKKDFSNKIFDAVIKSLREESGEKASDSPVLRFVVAKVEWLLKNVRDQAGKDHQLSTVDQKRLIESISECAWMAESDRQMVLINSLSLVSDEVFEGCKEKVPNYSVVSSFISGGSANAGSLLLAWLSICDDSGLNVSEAVKAAIRIVPSENLMRCLDRWRKRVTPELAAQMFNDVVSDPNMVPLDAGTLEAVGLCVVGEDIVVATIIDRFKLAATKQQKVEVLRVWKGAGNLNQKSKRELIETVLIPCLQDGGLPYREALDSFASLCVPVPKIVKQRLGELIMAGASQEGIDKNYVYGVLKSAGYRIKKKWFSKDTVEAEE